MTGSKRLEAVQTPIIPVVARLIRDNPGTISLGQGVVNYGPPQSAVDAIHAFLADPENNKYQMVEGIPQLQDEIAGKMHAENGVDIGDDRSIVVTAGANMGFLNAILAIADEGDEIIQLLPYYFNHEMAVTMVGCIPVPVRTDTDFQPRLDAIESAITKRTRAVVTISPNNPTGAVYSRQALEDINELCACNNIYHIHDEAYEYFTYDGTPHYSPASAPSSVDHTIALYSMSKAYGFAGWRIGWMIIPRGLLEHVRKIQDTNLICPPVVSQWAAAGALRAGSAFCRSRIAEISAVRRIVLDKLSEVSHRVRVIPAGGALYLLLELKTDEEDMAVVERLITNHRVAVIPGSTFGIRSGCFLRVAFGALDADTVTEGVDRLVTGLRV